MTDVDLYVTEGAMGNDPANYTEKRESSNTTEIVNWKVAAPIQYTVLVRHKTTNSPFQLEHAVTNDCSSGASQGKPLVQKRSVEDTAGRHYFNNLEMA